jgi:hypothetical protein
MLGNVIKSILNHIFITYSGLEIKNSSFSGSLLLM